MGAQTVERKRKFIQRYNEVEKSEGECFRRLTDSRGLSPLRPLGILVNPLGNDTQKLFRAVAKGSTMPRRSSLLDTNWLRIQREITPASTALCALYCCILFSSLGQEEMLQQKSNVP